MNIQRKKSNKSNYMMRTIFLLSILLVVLIALFSCAVTIFFSHQTDSIYTKLNSRALSQLAEFTDKYVFENVDAICNTYFNKEAEYDPAKKFFQDMENMTRDEMLNIQKDLFDIKKHNSFLNNIYIYNSRFDSFISTGDGIVFGASDTRNGLSIENRFFTYLDQINQDFYVPQDDNIMLRDQDGYIIYVHYVSADETSSFRRKQVSCVVMIIDVRNITEFIQSIEMPGIQSFAIIDNAERALIHSDNFPGIASLKEEDQVDFSRIMATHSGSMTKKFQNKPANYIWIQSALHDWNYVYILSRADTYQHVMMIIVSIVGLTLLVVLIGYVILKFYGKKLYKPFNSTIQKALDSLDSEEDSRDEIEILNQLIDKFGKRNIEYDTMYERYSDLSLYITASDLIKGFVPEQGNAFLEKLSAHGVDFSKKEYGLVLIEFNPSILATFTVDQSEFILYDVMDVLKATFNCVVTASAYHVLELVVNYDKLDYSRIINKLKKLIPEKSFVNFYICPVITDLTQLPACHTEAMAMTKYSYLYGFDNVFDVTELSRQDLDDRMLDPKELELIETLLKDGNKQRFYEECNRLLAAVKAENHSYNYAQDVVLKLFSVLCRVAKEYNVSLEQEAAFQKTMNNRNFDNTTVYLFNSADELFDKISNKGFERKFDLINNIKDFIEEHINEDISLSSVAQHFNISAGYLSKFFKENTDRSFSKYIIEKKFSYAAKALIEHPDKSIGDIANEAGYFDTAYFSRQFKAYYGVTPVQYRKLNQ